MGSPPSFLPSPSKNVLRVLVKRRPLEDENGKEVTTPKDYVVDFLFSDSYEDTEKTLELLEKDKCSFPDKLRILIHFGCSPNSYSWDLIHSLQLYHISQYECIRSIDAFDMAEYLGLGTSFGESFFEDYADAIASCASENAAVAMSRNPKALIYLFTEMLPIELAMKLRCKVTGGHEGSAREPVIVISLPNLNWNPIAQDSLSREAVSPSGLKLLIHYKPGEPFARMTLSHPFFVKEESQIVDCASLIKQRDLSKTAFRWRKLLWFSPTGEFAASPHPLMIYPLWAEAHPEIKTDAARSDWYFTYLVDEIAEVLEKVCGALGATRIEI